jgi:opacity protein-like surface antigen
MKMKLLTTCAFAALSLFSARAQAADVVSSEQNSLGVYVSLFGGASFLNDVDTTQRYDGADYDYSLETKTGYILGGAIGMRVWDPVRAEIELSYARWKADEYTGENDDTGNKFGDKAGGHVSATYLLGNVWIDIHTDTPFTPYVGGGAGVAWVDADTEYPKGNERFGYGDATTAFAFQAGAGVKYDVSENIAVDVSYRFKGILDVDFDGRESDVVNYEGGDLYSHNVQAGVTFGF